MEAPPRWTLAPSSPSTGPPAPCGRWQVAHSPSSSCLRASRVGSRLRGRRWHLASRILKRAFCLMGVAGAPGESQSPPRWWPLLWAGRWWGPGAAEGVPECEGAARGTNPPGAGGGGASAASFPQGLRKVKKYGRWGQGQARGPSARVFCGGGKNGFPPPAPSPKPVLVARASGKGAEERRQQGREGGSK